MWDKTKFWFKIKLQKKNLKKKHQNYRIMHYKIEITSVRETEQKQNTQEKFRFHLEKIESKHWFQLSRRLRNGELRPYFRRKKKQT